VLQRGQQLRDERTDDDGGQMSEDRIASVYNQRCRHVVEPSACAARQFRLPVAYTRGKGRGTGRWPLVATRFCSPLLRLNNNKFGQSILRKIVTIVATRCQT